MSDNCIFCKIAKGEIPCDKVYEDDSILAFKDIHPVSPVHLLIIPKQHTATLNDADASKAELLGKMLITASRLAKEAGVAKSGYRTIINCNRAAGQEVFHLHLHMMGGRPMGKMG